MKRAGTFLTILLAALLLLTACGETAQATWQEQYDLGVKYLGEGNYEEAILAFTAAIEIDPKRPEAYLSLADVYEAQKDWDAVRSTLENGYQMTESEDIQKRLEEFINQAQTDSSGSTPTESVYETTTEDGSETLRAENNQLVMSLDVPDLQSVYPVNQPHNSMDICEYGWMVQFTDGTNMYEVGTSYFKNSTVEESYSLYDMQSNVWIATGEGSYEWIVSAELEVRGTTMQWSFTIPEEYAFDAKNMKITGSSITIDGSVYRTNEEYGSEGSLNRSTVNEE